MIIDEFICKLLNEPFEIVKIVVELLLIILILQFKYRTNPGIIKLSEETVEKLIEEFEPEDIVGTKDHPDVLSGNYNTDYIDLSDYDVFELKNKHKTEIKTIVSQYGIGTCGPPTFYGTLDLHLELEKTIANVLETEEALLYSNYYACVQSVIACFCKAGDRVFFSDSAHESILRGLYHSKASTFQFDSMESLELLLESNIRLDVKNFVIVEGLSKNTGAIVSLPKLLALKGKFKFRIILDEGLSIPLLGPKGVLSYYKIPRQDIDMTIGSFSLVYPSNGGFFAGSASVCQYQRLSSSSHVFSASLPAFLTKFNILAFTGKHDLKKLQRLTRTFQKHFKTSQWFIISYKESPIIIITPNPKNFQTSKKVKYKLVCCVQKQMHSQSIYLGVHKNPSPSIRVALKISFDHKDILKLSKTLSKACDNAILWIKKDN